MTILSEKLRKLELRSVYGPPRYIKFYYISLLQSSKKQENPEVVSPDFPALINLIFEAVNRRRNPAAAIDKFLTGIRINRHDRSIAQKAAELHGIPHLSLIHILDKLGITDSLCFGSESGDIRPLSAVADILIRESEKYTEEIKIHLKNGNTFPKARSLAVSACTAETVGRCV